MLTPAQVSAAAHAALPHANPLTVAQVDALIAALAARQPATALDLGCGPGTLALRLAALTPTRVLAVDVNDDFLTRGRTDRRALLGAVDFVHADRVDLTGRSFDATICVGASQAVGTPRDALRWCRSATAPGRALLFAELTWAGDPAPAHLQALGVTEGFWWQEHEEAGVFADAGWQIERTERASADAWDTYEDAVHAGRLRVAETRPADEAADLRARAEAWRALRVSIGRTLGFSAYLATAR